MPYRPNISQIPDTEIFTTVTSSATISSADHRKYLCCTNSSGINLTLQPDSSSDPVLIRIQRCGAGSVTVALNLIGAITLNGATVGKSIGTRYQIAELRRIAQNTWVMVVFGA